MSDFVIFALPRTGSTTLMQLLICHDDIKCAHEPFNRFNRQFQLYDNVCDFASLDRAVREVRKSHNGIKHVWHSNGFPFNFKKGGERFNERLLLSFEKALLLTRENILQRIVSWHMSKETGVYAFSSEEERARFEGAPVAEIDMKLLAKELRFERDCVQRWRRLLRKRRIQFMNVSYEDLFLDSAGPGSQIRKVNRIIQFLGGRPVSNPETLSRLAALLEPSVKMNSRDSYMRIPNIHEVERVFGADQTGWVFGDQVCV